MESWRDKLRREARTVHDAIQGALAITDDQALRAQLEKLVPVPYFSAMTWLWGPVLATKNRVMFRPFILSSFSREALDRDGMSFNPWSGETAAPLQHWLDAVDALDDVDLTKRLYGWKLGGDQAKWRADLVARYAAATTPSARHVALAKIDGADLTLDAKTALALWQIDRTAAQPFILRHLPWRDERKGWQDVLAKSRDVDPKFHFELYRKLVEEREWREDVLALPTSPAISAELERRHPSQHWLTNAASVFHALLVKHGEPAIAYVANHADKVTVRYAWHGKAEGKDLPELIGLALARGWLPLWATLLRTSASRELFDAEVGKLVAARARARLEIVPGRGREFHGAGFSWAQTHALTDATATALYERYPDLVRGPFRMHVEPGWAESFPNLAAAAIAAGDHELVDYVASRVAIQQVHNASHKAAMELLAAHYEALSEAAFVPRAAGALSRMPAHAIWSYDGLLKSNALARLLFERSTALYLADDAAVRDLLESAQIHVQILAFRVLGQRDPRAPAAAAANADLLQATLLRKLRRPTRILAFAALANAARHDEPTARYVVGKIRDAFALPDRRYPKEQLVGLLGEILQRWPILRTAREQPVVYGLGGAAS